jgi:hypothetical protein
MTDSSLPPTLRADCSRCAGLCCVVPAFYAFQGFAFDKPAHAPCRHLTLEHQCEVHPELIAKGFPGCASFDCYGAGQRVTQELFEGATWRASAGTAAQMFTAFTTYLTLHQLMATLAVAEANFPPQRAAQIRARRRELDELCRSEDARAGRLDLGTLKRDAFRLLQDLL